VDARERDTDAPLADGVALFCFEDVSVVFIDASDALVDSSLADVDARNGFEDAVLRHGDDAH
jgi:hypothetical protein